MNVSLDQKTYTPKEYKGLFLICQQLFTINTKTFFVVPFKTNYYTGPKAQQDSYIIKDTSQLSKTTVLYSKQQNITIPSFEIHTYTGLKAQQNLCTLHCNRQC